MTESRPTGDKQLSVFISYSRDDVDIADQLHATLIMGGYDATIDREGIQVGEDWERRLGDMIRAADTILFLLSPSSACSEACAWEVEQATRSHKRIIPVVCRPLGEEAPPPALAALNYIHLYPEPRKPGTGFGPGILDLRTALNTDLEWLREHTRYLQRAGEWNAVGRPANRLLSGADVATAKAWAARRPKEAPEPTALHLDFIKESEAEESRRHSAEEQRLRHMAEAQSAREEAVELAEIRLREAQEAVRNRQSMRIAIGVLLVGVIVGLIGFINQETLRYQYNWYATMRPYINKHVQPYVHTAEQALAKKRFRECDENCPWMVVVPAGTFMMGSPPTEKDRNENEGPQRGITFAKPFAVAETTVTFNEWNVCVAVGVCRKVLEGGFGGGKMPVINLDVDDAEKYTQWLSQMTGRSYRLLTEAEWEYAARAGTTTTYPWGDEVGTDNANCTTCSKPPAKRQPTPVGSFKPNKFGLFDMTGNVYQWVAGCWLDTHDDVPVDGTAVMPGENRDCTRAAIRGGSWFHPAVRVRSAHRLRYSRRGSNNDIGLRVARTL